MIETNTDLIKKKYIKFHSQRENRITEPFGLDLEDLKGFQVNDTSVKLRWRPTKHFLDIILSRLIDIISRSRRYDSIQKLPEVPA